MLELQYSVGFYHNFCMLHFVLRWQTNTHRSAFFNYFPLLYLKDFIIFPKLVFFLPWERMGRPQRNTEHAF